MRLDHVAYRVADRKSPPGFSWKPLDTGFSKSSPLTLARGKRPSASPLNRPKNPWKDAMGVGQLSPCPGDFRFRWKSWFHCRRLGQGPGRDWGHSPYGLYGRFRRKTMEEWRAKGLAEFTSQQPLTCPGLTQVFTKPSELTGIIYEFIEREEYGFCKDNVRALMESTRGL